MVVDTLSRKPYLCSLTNISTDWKFSIIVEYVKNTFGIDILDGKLQDNRYKVVYELILYN